MTDDNRVFGEVKAKIDGLTAAFEDFREETRTWQMRCEGILLDRFGGRLDVHSARLRSLEVWRGWMTGALATLAVLWAAFQIAVNRWWK